MNSSNNKWLIEAPLSKNRNQGFYIETPLPKNRDQGFYIEAPLPKERDRGFYYDLGKGKNWGNDDFLEGFYDPFGEKERKERLEKIRVKPDNQIWSSQDMLSSQTDPFLEGFNGISTEENKWTPDLLKEKTPEILSPQLPFDTNHSLNELQNTFRNSQFDAKLNPKVQRINSSPSITPAINRNLNAKNEFEHAIGDPNKEPVMVQYSNDKETSDFNKVLDNTLKRTFYEVFSPVFLKPSAHTALWFAGAETYLKNKGYDTSAWLLKHSLQPNPEDVYRDDNSRIAQLIKNDSTFLKELDIAIANSDGKTLDTTIRVPFEQGDLYYSIHENNIKLTGYKDDNGKWKISAKLKDKYDFSKLMTGRGENGIRLGTLANDVAYFSEKIGAITPYYIYVDFNIER